MTRFSTYVPGAMRMVSPSAAASMAAPIVSKSPLPSRATEWVAPSWAVEPTVESASSPTAMPAALRSRVIRTVSPLRLLPNAPRTARTIREPAGHGNAPALTVEVESGSGRSVVVVRRPTHPAPGR